WMAVVVVAREMLVTALRGFIEQHGGDSSARTAGKLKMVFQCAAAALSLYSLTWEMPQPLPVYGPGWTLFPAELWHRPAWLAWSLAITVWASLITTIYSGAEHVMSAVRVMRRA
ncbi:MAG: CDP-alcohol phosphatidyltransferase family protein, partial [Pirellulales bacterium]